MGGGASSQDYETFLRRERNWTEVTPLVTRRSESKGVQVDEKAAEKRQIGSICGSKYDSH